MYKIQLTYAAPAAAFPGATDAWVKAKWRRAESPTNALLATFLEGQRGAPVALGQLTQAARALRKTTERVEDCLAAQVFQGNFWQGGQGRAETVIPVTVLGSKHDLRLIVKLLEVTP